VVNSCYFCAPWRRIATPSMMRRMARSPNLLLRSSPLLLFLLFLMPRVSQAVTTGQLRLQIMDNLGMGAKPAAEVFASDGKKVGEISPGGTLAVAPGIYKLVLPIIGGQVV